MTSKKNKKHNGQIAKAVNKLIYTKSLTNAPIIAGALGSAKLFSTSLYQPHS
jgi:hypothetical protein